jgi:large subunit ribosomal protein L18
MNKLVSIPYRRKRQGKTDYRKRMSLLISGKPRLVIRRSRSHLLAQIVEYHENGDKVLALAHSSELRKQGWRFGTSNMPASYLVGLLLGKKALSKGVKDCIVDLGLQSPVPRSKLYAAVKGAVDSGLAIPHSKEVFPSDDRIMGKHIAGFKAEGMQFSRLKKEGIAVAGITDAWKETKDKIMRLQNAKED